MDLQYYEPDMTSKNTEMPCCHFKQETRRKISTAFISYLLVTSINKWKHVNVPSSAITFLRTK